MSICDAGTAQKVQGQADGSNGTSTACLPATMNTSQTANTNEFFNDLITGDDLQQYQGSVFEQAKCTGCMYELYKAA